MTYRERQGLCSSAC